MSGGQSQQMWGPGLSVWLSGSQVACGRLASGPRRAWHRTNQLKQNWSWSPKGKRRTPICWKGVNYRMDFFKKRLLRTSWCWEHCQNLLIILKAFGSPTVSCLHASQYCLHLKGTFAWVLLAVAHRSPVSPISLSSASKMCLHLSVLTRWGASGHAGAIKWPASGPPGPAELWQPV